MNKSASSTNKYPALDQNYQIHDLIICIKKAKKIALENIKNKNTKNALNELLDEFKSFEEQIYATLADKLFLEYNTFEKYPVTKTCSIELSDEKISRTKEKVNEIMINLFNIREKVPFLLMSRLSFDLFVTPKPYSFHNHEFFKKCNIINHSKLWKQFKELRLNLFRTKYEDVLDIKIKNHMFITYQSKNVKNTPLSSGIDYVLLSRI
eukprot:gnl/TRDRNA2_/TRDRNA2_177941_c0_seq4.p1 gnl/TRDRNA2_/TRDRNA2_177941_c0~~gnl/TRDRNA2_/TRDRNA2_177941_c0_seq4.p1  ORF type:complete len:208 (+),score=3.74 gnl/TRDRNA2_/TRDRNA2_177941_c0_seq4:1300-1923(+)